jgi:hypothetical protein
MDRLLQFRTVNSLASVSWLERNDTICSLIELKNPASSFGCQGLLNGLKEVVKSCKLESGLYVTAMGLSHNGRDEFRRLQNPSSVPVHQPDWLRGQPPDVRYRLFGRRRRKLGHIFLVFNLNDMTIQTLGEPGLQVIQGPLYIRYLALLASSQIQSFVTTDAYTGIDGRSIKFRSDGQDVSTS